MQGLASDVEDFADLAVTDKGVTLTPEQVITDGHMVTMTFSVEGWNLPDDLTNLTPVVKHAAVKFDSVASEYMGEEDYFYNGITWNEGDKEPHYDDGTALTQGDDGQYLWIPRYEDADGKLSLIVRAYTTTDEDIQGQDLQVNLTDLGILGSDQSFTEDSVDGEWDFIIPITTVSNEQEYSVDTPVDGTDIIVEKVTLSPISVRLDYSSGSGENKILFRGVILKNGKKLWLENGGFVSDDFERCAFSQVIDPAEVETILISLDDYEEEEALGDCVEIRLK